MEPRSALPYYEELLVMTLEELKELRANLGMLAPEEYRKLLDLIIDAKDKLQ